MKKLLVCLFISIIFATLTNVRAQKINTEGSAYLPDPSWQVVSHQKMGTVDLSTVKIREVISSLSEKENQETGVLNACILDYLVNNPEKIPPEWKKYKKVVFTGTLYKDPGGGLLYRCLSFWDDNVEWSRIYVGDKIYDKTAVVKI